MLTEYEKSLLRKYMISGTFNIHQWAAYLTFLVGRPVTLVETDDFLKEESERRFGKPKWEDTWNGLQRTN